MLAAARERRQKALGLSRPRFGPRNEGMSAVAPATVEGCSRAAVSLSVAASMLARHRLGQENAHAARRTGAKVGATKDADIPATRDRGDHSRGAPAGAGTVPGLEPKRQRTQQKTTDVRQLPVESAEPLIELAFSMKHQALPMCIASDQEPEPEPELEPTPTADSSFLVQHVHSKKPEHGIEELRQQLAAAEAAQRTDRDAFDSALAELERHKAALVEAEMEAVVSRLESQQAIADAVRVQQAKAARLAASRDANAAEETAKLRRQLEESQRARTNDEDAAAAQQLELNRVTAALSAAEVQLTEARRELQQAQETGHAGSGRLRRVVERAQRSEAESEHLREQLDDMQKAHCEVKAAMQIELQHHKSSLTEAQERLAEATLNHKNEQALHLEDLERLRSQYSAAECRRRKAEAALAACRKRLSTVEAADRRRQLATTADKDEAEAATERQIAFSKRLDAVLAELEEVEALCENEKAQHEEDLQREKNAAKAHREDGERLRDLVQEKEAEGRALQAQLEETRAEKAAVERKLLGATEARDYAVAEAQNSEKLRKLVQEKEAESQALRVQLQEARAEKTALEMDLLGVTRARDNAVAEVQAVRLRAEMEMEMANAKYLAAVWQQQMASAAIDKSKTVGVAAAETVGIQTHGHAGEVGLGTYVRPRILQERKQADPRAALRWAHIRMQLMRLDGESQRRQRHSATGRAESVAETPGRGSQLEGNSGALSGSFVVSPVREPTETAAENAWSHK